MRRIAAIGMVAVLGFGVAACGSSKDDARTESTQSGLTATTPTTERSTTTSTTEPTLSALNDLLLTAAEVGPGWTASPPSSDSSNDLPACFQGLEQLSPDRTSAEAEFDADDGDYFSEGLEYAGTSVIKGEFDAVKAQLDTCTEVTIEADGTSVTGTMKPMPLTSGDMSAAYELTFLAGGQTLVLDAGIVGVDGYEMTTFMGFVGAQDAATFQSLTDKAVAKVRAGGGQTA